MLVPWSFGRCIICLATVDSCHREHVIPESLGGRLHVRFLCKECNGTHGRGFEARAKEDPAVRIAIERLRGQLKPTLYRKLTDGQAYIGVDAGSRRGRLKNGVFLIDTVRAKDGSLVQPPEAARKHVAKVMTKRGHDTGAIARALQLMDEAPPNTRVDLAEGIAAIRQTGTTLQPDLNAPPLSARLLIKIAYEFLVLHIGEVAYAESEPLASIRAAIRQGQDRDLREYPIEHLTSRAYSPMHALALVEGMPHAVIKIVLFDFLRFRVHFPRVSLKAPRAAYVCPLDGGEEALFPIDQPAS